MISKACGLPLTRGEVKSKDGNINEIFDVVDSANYNYWDILLTIYFVYSLSMQINKWIVVEILKLKSKCYMCIVS
jgi:hypothetical protein